MNYAGFWARFLASLIDSLVICVAFGLLFALVTVMGLELAGMPFIYLAIALLYGALMHASARQATYGKALLGLKVTIKHRPDGGTDTYIVPLATMTGEHASRVLAETPSARRRVRYKIPLDAKICVAAAIRILVIRRVFDGAAGPHAAGHARR